MPKAFVLLAGRPMIEWSLDALRASPSVAAIVVAVPPGWEHGLEVEVPPDADGSAGPTLHVVDGGATRADSVANALAAAQTELVAIHDAARPLLRAELVEALVETLEADPKAAGVIAAAPLTDTVKELADDRVIGHTIDRSRLWAAQTPQVFRAAALREGLVAARQRAGEAAPATDEAMLVEAIGGRVLVHPSGVENLKVTTPVDLRLAELLLASRSVTE